MNGLVVEDVRAESAQANGKMVQSVFERQCPFSCQLITDLWHFCGFAERRILRQCCIQVNSETFEIQPFISEFVYVY